jgi:hypothetical protein
MHPLILLFDSQHPRIIDDKGSYDPRFISRIKDN